MEVPRCNFSFCFIFVLLLGCFNGTLNFCVDLFLLRVSASDKVSFFIFVLRISLGILASLLLLKFMTVLKKKTEDLEKDAITILFSSPIPILDAGGKSH